MTLEHPVGRRRVLGAVGAATLVSIAGCADDDPEDEPADDEDDDPDDAAGIEPGEMVFEGWTAGWEGVEPDAVAGEQNPTIALQEGETYTFTWTNEDGGRHNIEIRDGDDEVVGDYQTEIIEEQGADQSLEFEVEEGMVYYVCEPHESTMRGEIEVV